MIDFDLNDNPIQNNDVSLIFQQIDMLFDTKPREVLGFEDFGTNYDKFLFDLNISNSAIEYAVLSDLAKLDLLGFSPSVTAYILQGTEHDIILIDIILSRDEEQYNRSYKIS